ncbi:hypothetical protein BFW86_22550 [Pseudomonas fluorescens]|nr:hypothetical protein BFW86_22550 [Pseudomonas fluorescens]
MGLLRSPARAVRRFDKPAHHNKPALDPQPEVVVKALGDSAVTLSLRVWVDNEDYWDVMYAFNERARDALARKASRYRFRNGW